MMLQEAIEKFTGRGKSKAKPKDRKEEPNFGVSEEEVRNLAYLIWEKDQNRAAEECWLEAENRIKNASRRPERSK